MRGYFGIGIYHGKTAENIGTLWRSAYAYGADFIFTVGRRYKQQCSDVGKAWRHIPLWNFSDMDDLQMHIPYDCRLVSVELAEQARSLATFVHPERAIYLLGAEDNGLPADILSRSWAVVQIPSAREFCLNVATAGSLVAYDRYAKIGR